MNRKVIEAELDYSESVGRYQGLRDALELLEQSDVSEAELAPVRRLLAKAVTAREVAWARFNSVSDA